MCARVRLALFEVPFMASPRRLLGGFFFAPALKVLPRYRSPTYVQKACTSAPWASAMPLIPSPVVATVERPLWVSKDGVSRRLRLTL